MPKIDVSKKVLQRLLVKMPDDTTLESWLETCKAELEQGDDNDTLRIELNDTNRPDLWSAAGIARQLNQWQFNKKYDYPFFSSEKTTGEIIVDKNMQSIRPFIVAFTATGCAVDDDMLVELIQLQEKLTDNYGSRRKTVAIGVYRLNRMTFPVHYKGYTPDGKSFAPLEYEEAMPLSRILNEHPKGKEFAHLINDKPLYPIVEDATGAVLSMPPIINSNDLGAVQVGDGELFIEMTGTWLSQLMLAANIFACDMHDRGFTITPCRITYSYNTEFGKKVICPHDLKNNVTISAHDFKWGLGENVEPEEAKKQLERMGVTVQGIGTKMTAKLPPYRNDYMHAMDAIEDYAIGRGLNNFKPVMPPYATVGNLSTLETFCEKVRVQMAGLGFEEITSNILSSKERVLERQLIPDDPVVEISNPMTANYAVLRSRILPSLLDVEAASGNSAYPHHIFELGEIVRPDRAENYGSVTLRELGALTAYPKSNVNEMKSILEALAYYISLDYSLAEADRQYFIPGRSAAIHYGDAVIGEIGELHPQVLDNWGIKMPCTYVSLLIDPLVNDKNM